VLNPAHYKTRYRDAAEQTFRDGSEWCSCADFILMMRSQFSAHPKRDFQVVDESGLVFASTLEEGVAQRAGRSN